MDAHPILNGSLKDIDVYDCEVSELDAIARDTEPFPPWLCLADLQYVDGLGEEPGAPGTAAQLTENSPGLELRVRALAG